MGTKNIGKLKNFTLNDNFYKYLDINFEIEYIDYTNYSTDHNFGIKKI